MNILTRTFEKLNSPRRRQHAARNLDPHVRQALCDAVSEETAAGADALREVQAELMQSNEQLKEIQEREQFLGLRTSQYRKALEEQMVLLHAEQDRLTAARKIMNEGGEGAEEEKVPKALDEEAMDPEEQTEQSIKMSAEELEQAEAALKRRTEKWQADEQTLSSIVETHKVILASCENMRRSILVLQEKEKQILKMRGDCQKFLETAAELEHEEEEGPERRMEEHVADESERNGSQNSEGNQDAAEVGDASEDGHLEDVAV